MASDVESTLWADKVANDLGYATYKEALEDKVARERLLMPQGWTAAEIERAHTKVAKEARRLASRLGARCVLTIAFFQDDDGTVHMIDAGQTPIPPHEVYERLLDKIYQEAEQQAPAEPQPVQ